MLDVRHTDSHLLVKGALDREGAATFLRAVASATGDVQVDASRLERIDGAGLTALAIARLQCRAEGRAFALTRLAPDAVRGLRARDEMLTLFATPPSAPPEAPAEAATTSAPPAPRSRRRFGRHLTRLNWNDQQHGK
jgi:ABC-type transporter Mla MlaB component